MNRKLKKLLLQAIEIEQISFHQFAQFQFFYQPQSKNLHRISSNFFQQLLNQPEKEKKYCNFTAKYLEKGGEQGQGQG